MLPIKQKLNSKRGASMIMAMVFLLFCLLIGGSVYANATVNGSRIENMTDSQQEYYSQRSAMMLMADLLTDMNGEELQVLVTDVVQQPGGHTVTISCPNLTTEPSIFQKTLLKAVVNNYEQEGVTVNYPETWKLQQAPSSPSGTLYMACDIDFDDVQTVNYKIHTPVVDGSKDFSMELTFDAEKAHFILNMDGSVSTGTPKIVPLNNVVTTTTTTLIHWNLPDVQKIPVADENQAGGN